MDNSTKMEQRLLFKLYIIASLAGTLIVIGVLALMEPATLTLTIPVGIYLFCSGIVKEYAIHKRIMEKL